MLNQHSRLSVPFESVFVPEFFRRLREFGDLTQPSNMAFLLDAIGAHPFVVKGRLIPDPAAVLARNPETYPQLIDAIFSQLATARGKVRWGDKTPSYVIDMEILWLLFPGCKFVHLIRDGRDVATSLRYLSWGSKDLVKLARDWSWKVTLGRKMGEMIPQNYLEVHYEQLVRFPESTLAQICEFLGEPFEESMLRYPETAVMDMPAASLGWHESSVSAPDEAKMQAWRHGMSQSDQIVFEQVAGATLEIFGYEVTSLRPTIKSRIKLAGYALLGHA